MKADQSIPRTEIFTTRLALQVAMRDVGQTTGCDWLSSRQSSHRPGNLIGVLGGSGYFNKPEEKRTDD